MFVALVVVALSSACGVVHAATVASVDAGAAGTLTQPQRGLAANSGLIYYPLPTANDYMSYTYDDSQKGLNGVCSPTNKCGPSTWKNIQAVSPTVNACAGQSQTPVNIQALDVVNDPTLTYPTFSITSGGCSSWVEFTTLERFGFSFSETGNTCTNFQVTYGGKTWTLTGGHTHSPSEHTFGGGYHDAELHLVHTSSDGKLLVLAINFVADTGGVPNGAAQATLNVMWNAASSAYTKAGGPNTPALPGAVTYDWTVAQTSPYDFYRNLLPPSRAYYTYTGSYTTYPCTEGITWIVFEQPVRISKNDLAIMRAALAGNPNTIADPATGNDNRPVQPLNGRIIKRYTGVDPPTSSPTYKPVAIDPSTSAVAVASFLSSTSGAALTAALSSQFPGIVVSNAVAPTITATGVSFTQNIPAGITTAQAAADPFKSAYIAVRVCCPVISRDGLRTSRSSFSSLRVLRRRRWRKVRACP
jgi:carbonic anhydrase